MTTSPSKSDKNLTPEEIERFHNDAAGYYLGLWNILQKENVPVGIIMDASINNMLAVLDGYLSPADKILTIEKILSEMRRVHSHIETVQ